jgi:hypothetical protein
MGESWTTPKQESGYDWDDVNVVDADIEDADADIDNLKGEVSVAEETIDPSMGLSDEEAFAYKIVRRAAKLKGVRIERDVFLRTELIKHCPSSVVDAAVETTTQQAGVSMEVMDALAESSIDLETKKVAGLSALAGIPGGLAVFGTIPADLVNYFAHVLRIEQKLAYIYGWPSFLDDDDEIDDETMYKLILFLGVVLQVGGINVSLTNFAARTAAVGIAKSIEKQALTKTFWYPILKKVMAVLGVKVTKKSFANVVAKGVPLLGGAISGGITWATYRPGAESLKNHLRLLPQATGGVVDEAELEAALEAESERERRERDERLAGMRDNAVEFATGAASAASEAAQSVTNTIGGAFGGFASRFSRKKRPIADSSRDAPSAYAATEPAPEPARSARSMSDVAEELRTLKTLLDEGIISQEDFDAKKAALLGL